MKKVFIGAGLCALLLVLASGNLSAAVSASMVGNGDFEQTELNEWVLYGNNNGQEVLKASEPTGQVSWCNKWRPGSNRGNGGIKQDVYLIGGLTYEFSANIAFRCSC